tara:strand:- start:333 stop:587 length:255 start_codon:yes stop_codon:yes gene_type:complete
VKKTSIRRVSPRKAAQLKEEALLKASLLVKTRGLCEICHQPPDFRGLSKHEIVSRARGGSPVDELNCLLVCGKDHAKLHNINEI